MDKNVVYREWAEHDWSEAADKFNCSELFILKQVMSKVSVDSMCEENLAWVNDTDDFVLIVKGPKSIEPVPPVFKYDSIGYDTCVRISEAVLSVNIGRNIALEEVAVKLEKEREKRMKGDFGNE